MLSSPSHPAEHSVWYPGIDWLRALFIVFVVAMHLNLAQEFASSLGREGSITIYDLLLNQLFCTAVPGFLAIAMFLQALKNPSKEAAFAHLVNTLYLYAFWAGSWILCTHAKPEPGFIGLLVFILKGGGWAFYFFVSLFLLHVILVCIRGLSCKWLWAGLGASALVVSLAFTWTVLQGRLWMKVETYWWPLCFLPIPFAGLLLARSWPRISQDDRQYSRLLIWLMGLSLLFAFIEWTFSADAAHLARRPFLPEYLRLSPALTSCVMLLLALKVRSAPAVVGFIARNSLGIFCMHVFILRGLHQEIASLIHPSELAGIVTLVVVVVGGAWTTEFVRKLFRERLV